MDFIFQFCFLPFRLSTAPRTFTKCLVSVASYLRLCIITIFPYINYWLVVTDSCHKAKKDAQFTLVDLGLNVNFNKLHPEPFETMDYIGAHLDSTAVRAFLPHEMIVKLKHAILPF